MDAAYDRKAGLLLHISSLPGPYGVGDMGPEAETFANFLAAAGFRAWQTLPLVPTSAAFGYSPYSCPSAFAGNVLFISPDRLCEWGLIEKDELRAFVLPCVSHVCFADAIQGKKKILLRAYENFRGEDAYKKRYKKLSDEFWDFCLAEAHWLEDYALFTALKEIAGDVAWSDWLEEYAKRDWAVLDPLKRGRRVARLLDRCRFEQFLFFRQLADLRKLCAERGIELIGDLPIYVGYDSADVWGHQDLFELDEKGRPTVVAGVPPDYFSETGQRWGNPIYRWGRMRGDGYGWWMNRFRQALVCADRVRVDHFRGFLGYWEIPAEEKTAVNGAWRSGPGRDFFLALHRTFGAGGERLPFIAEDLGVITDDVREAMNKFGLPGMKVLQFAFGEGMPQSPYAPHMHRRNSAVYTGTHDNDTTLGWWRKGATAEERANLARYLGVEQVGEEEIVRTMKRLAYASTAELIVIPVQDALGLGSEARMNVPSTPEHNWTWRLSGDERLEECAEELRELAVLYGRFEEPKGKEKKSGGA